MRNLIIERKKAFTGCALSYDCILNLSSKDYNEYVHYYNNITALDIARNHDRLPIPEDLDSVIFRYQIKNGQKVIIPIEESMLTIFVSKGGYYSNQLKIESGKDDVYIVIKTYFSIKGMILMLLAGRARMMNITLTGNGIVKNINYLFMKVKFYLYYRK